MRAMVFLMVMLFCVVAFRAHAIGLFDSMQQSAAGMRVQSERMKVVAQNIANANTTSPTAGGQPYRRKTITFKNKLNRQTGVTQVVVDKIGEDNSTDFSARYDPAHPAANEEGFVLYPNVKTPLEMMDMREAERSYEANLGAIQTTRDMYLRTIEVLR